MKQKILDYIKKWESQGYPEGLPDEADAKLEGLGKVPSYRQICRAILKNDVSLSSLGYAREASEAYSAIKRVELAERAKKLEAK